MNATAPRRCVLARASHATNEHIRESAGSNLIWNLYLPESEASGWRVATPAKRTKVHGRS